jgi:hypothetical protein
MLGGNVASQHAAVRLQQWHMLHLQGQRRLQRKRHGLVHRHKRIGRLSLTVGHGAATSMAGRVMGVTVAMAMMVVAVSMLPVAVAMAMPGSSPRLVPVVAMMVVMGIRS